MKMEPKEKEPKKFESIEELNQFLSSGQEQGGYAYGHDGLDINELLEDYGRLREFSLAVRNLIDIFDETDWREQTKEDQKERESIENG